MEQLRRTSPDLTQENIEKLADLFPSVVTEKRNDEGEVELGIDFDLLRQELSDHLVEGPQERYQLDWPGKRQAAMLANAPIAKTLRPMLDESVDFDTTQNVFIEGDNLDALKLLQESYLGKVKLIYIDPPYNTGNDFVYEDDFAETTQEYLERSGQVDDEGTRLVANPETSGRYHSDWLSMMYPRLKLARNLLRDDGLVMVSVDDNEVANLRRLCAEIFGESNFVGQFVWQTKNAARGVPPTTMLMANHEYVVVYGRQTGRVRFKGLPRDPADFANPDNDPRGLWRSESMKATGGQDNYFDVVDPQTGNSFHANWAFSEGRFAEMIKEGLVLFPAEEGGAPRQKKFLNSYLNARKAFVTSLGWFSTEKATKQLMALFDGKKTFDFPKPLELMEFLVDQATSKDDLIVDFFAGSGSTAHAVLAVNAGDSGSRRYVLVQAAEPTALGSAARAAGFLTVSSMARERLRRAEVSLEGGAQQGFRSLRVGASNFETLQELPGDVEQLRLDGMQETTRTGSTPLDLLFQVLLDWGLELSLPIETLDLGGHEVLVVDDGVLAACFDREIDLELVKRMAELEPLRAVFLDSAFASDAERINTEQIFREVSPSTDVKVI